VEKPADRGRLGRGVVLAAALELLDDVGLDGLTLRRLAQELGVQAPALYWYFRSKRELMDHLAQAIYDEARPEVRPSAGQPWAEWFAERARAQRRALLAHRDGARVVAGSRPLDSMVPLVEKVLVVMREIGFPPGYALRCIVNTANYVAGFVMEEQAEQRRFAEDRGFAAEDVRAFVAALGKDHPTMAAALDEVGDPGGDAGFEHGLQLMIDGMRAALDRSRAVEAGR
jgi:TetR/AcrR family tetracycline transcriptional repressor